MLKRLRRAVKEINRKQNGQVLIMVLIVLALGAIVLAPTLNHAASSIKHQQLIETDALELYAADSGIDYALFKLSNGETAIDDYPLDGKTVAVSITDQGDGSYLITSTATSAGGSNTTIRTGVSSSGGGFAFLFDSAITSPGTITLKNDSVVTGNVTYGEDLDNKGTVDGEEIPDSDLINNWPTADFFDTFYEDLVLSEGATPVGDTTIPSGSYSLENPCPVGPLYVDGKLTVKADFIRLDGTVYVTGDIEFKNTCTIILNGQTIFAKGNIDLKNGFTSIGNGCIIAIGDITVMTNGDTDPDGFLFLMSISGTVQVNNGDNIYGCIAGEAEVELKNGCDLTWKAAPTGEGDLNFPSDVGVVGGSTEDMVLRGWDIS